MEEENKKDKWAFLKKLILVILSIVGAIFGVGTIINNDNSNNNSSVSQISIGSGDNVARDKNTYYNGIPDPQIDFQKIPTISSSLIIELWSLKKQYLSAYKLTIKTVTPIPRITLYTENKELVTWVIINKPFNSSIENENGYPSSKIHILENVESGTYIINLATTTNKEINLKYTLN